MSDNLNNINLWFDAFDEQFRATPDIIAETAVEHYKERFLEKNWEGVPWQPASPKTKQTKGSLMMRTNNLFSSIRPSVVRPDRVTISAGSLKVPYARIHNEGGRIRGVQYVRPYTHPNLLGKGRTQVQGHARKVDFRMPKRQFIGYSRTLNDRIMSRLRAHFNG